MKKLMIGIAATTGILGCSLYELYSAVYCVNDKKFRPTVPKGEQYEARRKKIREMIEEADALPYEEVETVSADGHRLWGRFYRGKEDAPFELMFHGYKSHAIRDFSGGLPDGVKAGMNVLVVDQRAHGKSEGSMITFGAKEQDDMTRWIRTAIDIAGDNSRILLHGWSMGAAVVYLAAANGLPSQVKGVIYDCGYGAVEAQFLHTSQKITHFPITLLYFMIQFMKPWCRILGGFDMKEASPLFVARNMTLPILFVHGAQDSVVPVWMGKKLCAATTKAGYRDFLLVQDADHTDSYLRDKANYEKKIIKLWKACTKN